MTNIVNSNAEKKLSLKTCRIIAYSIIMFMIIWYGWVSDDAYQGLAQVRNLFNGGVFGYNMNERVNASTCILFDFLAMIPYSLTKDLFWSALIVNILSSGVAIYFLLFKFCDTRFKLICTSIIICLSYYFLCFCTSGLENSLIFMFSTLFIYMYLKTEKWTFSKLSLLGLIDAGLLLSRLDMAITFLVPSAYIFLFKRDNKSIVKMILAGIIGLLPVISWLIFSLWYYGVMFPTTFYAKLNAGVPKLDMFASGFAYFVCNIFIDILFSAVMLFCTFYIIMKGKFEYKIFGFSLIARLLYVISIGGDFMYGRMLTDIFFIVLCLFVTMDIDGVSVRLAKYYKYRFVLIFCIASISSLFNIFISAFLIRDERVSYVDERSFYCYEYSIQSKLGLFDIGDLKNPFGVVVKYRGNDSLQMSAQNHAEKCAQAGYKGFVFNDVFFGSAKCYIDDIYITDVTALGDLFLAHLQIDYDPNTWRVGHNIRTIPAGYAESLHYDCNLIEDPSLHQYYDVILELTRGDLFDSNRWQLIWDFNTGKYDYLLDEYYANLSS